MNKSLENYSTQELIYIWNEFSEIINSIIHKPETTNYTIISIQTQRKIITDEIDYRIFHKLN